MTAETQAMTLRIPTDQHERLRKLAFDRRVSMNSLAEAFIAAGLDEAEHAPSRSPDSAP